MHISRLQWATLTAIALSPVGWTQAATAAPGSVVVPTVPIYSPSPAPSYPGASAPTRPNTPAVVVPIYTPGTTPGRPTTPGRLPPVPTPKPTRPVYGASQPPASGTIYRVVVANSSDFVQQQVKSLVPQAFRTSINGQAVMQVGVFREQSKALELQQFLNQNNLQASILTGQAATLPAPAPRVDPPRPNPGSSPLPSVPRSNAVVVIDPGHGGADPGAVGIGGLRESEVVLDISRQVAALLKQQGVEAVLTRQRDEEIELEPRVQFAERADADVFVSIHANAFSASRSDVNGIETYYTAGGSGQSLARLVQDSLLQELGARDRGVKTANFYVIRNTSMPAILVETGFVTGAEDAARLSSTSGRSRIARAIAKGILEYVR